MRPLLQLREFIAERGLAVEAGTPGIRLDADCPCGVLYHGVAPVRLVNGERIADHQGPAATRRDIHRVSLISVAGWGRREAGAELRLVEDLSERVAVPVTTATAAS